MMSNISKEMKIAKEFLNILKQSQRGTPEIGYRIVGKYVMRHLDFFIAACLNRAPLSLRDLYALEKHAAKLGLIEEVLDEEEA